LWPTATDGTVSIENLQELASGFSTGSIWTLIYFRSCQIWNYRPKLQLDLKIAA